LVLLTLTDGSVADSLDALGLTASQNFADANNILFKHFVGEPSTTLPQALAENPTVVVAIGDMFALPVLERAKQAGQVRFVVYASTLGETLPNVQWLGGVETRTDMQVFVAGYLAGLGSQGIVGLLLPPNHPQAPLYTNSFKHGVLQACACEVYPLLVNDYNNPAEGLSAAKVAKNYGADTLFALRGGAGDAALLSAASNGLRVGSLDGDLFSTLFAGGQPVTLPAESGTTDTTAVAFSVPANLVLPTVVLRLDTLLDEILPDVWAGTIGASVPFHAAGGTIGVGQANLAGLNPAERLLVEDVLASLASGKLGTGVDPLTGIQQ
jgi:basic membrane lipoprotein Med (substrate-binding protein (PBP1-ABC) superfamily)